MKKLNLSFDEELTEDEERSQNLPGMYDDFIGTYHHALDDEFCKEIIDAFDYHYFAGGIPVWQEDDQFENSSAGRFDWALDLEHIAPKMYGEHPARELNEILFNALSNYVHTYGHLKGIPMGTFAQKIQKTPAGGGYHVWHDESTSYTHNARILVWMIYLNDDFEGGETEFLYYKKRVQPKKGTLLIWPAGLTHCHRGGMVLSGDKYVVTGWFNATELAR